MKITLLLIATLFSPATLLALEKQPIEVLRPKSMPLGVVLGLDPLSGDGLIYAGHPIQGGIAMGIQVAGFIGGLIYYSANSSESTSSDPFAPLGGIKQAGIIFAATTIPTYLWDAIGTPIYIHQRNKKIRESIRVSPRVSLTDPQGLGAELQVQF